MRRATGRGPLRCAAAALLLAGTAAPAACAAPSAPTSGGSSGRPAALDLRAVQATPAPDPALAEDTAAVGDVWWRYLQGVRARDGAAASGTVTAATLARYEAMRDAARTADRAALERLPLSAQLTVMVWRVRVPAAVLRTASGRDLLARSVGLGLNGDGASSGLADAAPAGDTAVGHYLRGTDGGRGTAHFRREAAGWRLDLLPLMDAVDAAAEQQWRASGLSRADFVARSLAADLTPQQVAAAYAPAG